MASPKFSIPTQYEDQLKYVPSSDTRTDSEIFETLARHVPVTSEKNVWAFWDAGAANMTAWCRRNVASWVRMNGPSWSIRIVDNVPRSENYALKWVAEDQVPACFVQGTMGGPYTGPHSADFLRGALLYRYGGVFMDVGCILFRTLERICWNQLADPTSPFQVSAPWMYGEVIANSFIAARKGDPFIKRWHELFMHLWSGRSSHVGIMKTPLFAFMAKKSFEDSRANNFHWDFKIEAAAVFDYIAQVSCWKRLALLEDAGDGFSPTDYWQNKVLLFDVLKENWAIEEHLKWDNAYARALELLATKMDTVAGGGHHKEAEGLVYRLLAGSSMQKITHGKGLTHTPALGVLWEMAENEGKDAAPGTFAELLRYGAENFEQTRESIRYVKAPVPAATMEKGLLEP